MEICNYILYNSVNETSSRPSNKGELIITEENQCNKLLNENYWSYVVVSSLLCTAGANLTILNNPYLEEVTFYRETFKNSQNLVISNNPRLESIFIKESAFQNTNSVIIRGIVLKVV